MSGHQDTAMLATGQAGGQSLCDAFTQSRSCTMPRSGTHTSKQQQPTPDHLRATPWPRTCWADQVSIVPRLSKKKKQNQTHQSDTWTEVSPTYHCPKPAPRAYLQSWMHDMAHFSSVWHLSPKPPLLGQRDEPNILVATIWKIVKHNSGFHGILHNVES